MKKLEKTLEIEKECSKHGMATFYLTTSGRYLCRRCNIDKVKKRRKIVKILSIEYKGGACSKCGYNKCLSALEFHHIDPTQKDFSPSDTGQTRSWEIVKAELDKCILVCSNCHREIHDQLLNKEGSQDIPSMIQEIQASRAKKSRIKSCEYCSSSFKWEDEKRFCSSECYHASHRKVKDRPTKEELKRLSETLSMCEIGRMYKVSDNAVRKWLRKKE
jgi:hypothetical protein